MTEGNELGRSSRSSSERTSGDELETARVSPAGLPKRPDAAPTSVGASLGRYVVLEEIGRGGMGRVLRAYDPKLQREVALKEVRGKMLGSEGTGRLVAEARAMARLSHPNVVAVYDVEEPSPDQVVLVMQYVAGKTLRAWLREGDRPWSDVVARFIEAGRGLAAAHAAGLLHRDFKPANVLVQSDAAVKVTDFGLAKQASEHSSSISEPGGGDSSVQSGDELTEAGTVLGTPRYMAPEQHRPGRSRSGMDIPLTAAADQYAFCVALWEALCGAAPFSGKHLAADKEGGPPPWPESKVPRTTADAIVRGLAPDPGQRWPSMDALLEVLSDASLVRRNRWLMALGGVGVLALGGTAFMYWSATRAARCTGAVDRLAGVWDDARRAEVQTAIAGIDTSYAPIVSERAVAELDRYTEDWAVMRTEACEATTVRGAQSIQLMDLRMGCLRRAKVQLAATVDVLASADEAVVHKAHALTAGLPPLSRCADAEALQSDVEPPLPAEAGEVERIRTLLAKATAAREGGRYARAQVSVEEARAAIADVEYGPVRTEVALARGAVASRMGQYDAAEEALEEALALASQWRQPDEMADAMADLMYVVGYLQHRTEEGLHYRAPALALAGEDPVREARARNALATVLFAQGSYEEAESEQRRVQSLREMIRGPEHPSVAAARSNLAATLLEQGKVEEAEAEHRQVLLMRRSVLGNDHPAVARSHSNLGNALLAMGKYAEAEAEYRRALAIREDALGPEHPGIADAQSNLANALHRQGKGAEAEIQHRRALALREKTLGAEHPDVGWSHNNLAVTLAAAGKFSEAEAEHHRALPILEKTLGLDHPDVAMAWHSLASLLRAQDKYPEAEAASRKALARWETAMDADHPFPAQSRHTLAAVLLAQGRQSEALEYAERAWDRRKRDDIPLEHRAQTAFLLARVLWRAKHSAPSRARARTLGARAFELFTEAGDAYEEEAVEVRAWLDGPR